MPKKQSVEPRFSLRIPPPVEGKHLEPVQLCIEVGTRPEKMTVSAYIVHRYFAIHMPTDIAEHGFCLSHIPTGRGIAWSDEISKLFGTADKLAALGDWNFCELDQVPEAIRDHLFPVLKDCNVSRAGAGRHLVQ